jgi:hypothetical protein
MFAKGKSGSRGQAAPAKDEGVGEHVRIRFQRRGPPLKLRTEDPHRIKNRKAEALRSLPNRLPEGQALHEMTVQPFDLMSRRHPLRRPEPALQDRFKKQTVVGALVTSPAASRRQFSEEGLLLLLGNLLRLLGSLLHCALRCLLRLLSFLGHVALLNKVIASRCVHSGIEMHYIPNTPTH